MASMQLTSVRRARLYATGDAEDLLTDELVVNRQLSQWISVVSTQVEQWLNRTLKLASRVEFFDVNFAKDEYRPQAVPVTIITKIEEDASGLFTGAESELTDFHLGQNERSIVLAQKLNYLERRALKITYTGGVALSGVNSVFVMTTETSTPTVGNFLTTSDKSKAGVVVAYAASSLTLENFYGVFEDGDILTEFTTVALDVAEPSTPYTATISSTTSQGLAELHPDIVTAVEMQVRYYWKHALDLENEGTTRDGATIRQKRKGFVPRPFLEEVYALLQPHRRMNLGL